MWGGFPADASLPWRDVGQPYLPADIVFDFNELLFAPRSSPGIAFRLLSGDRYTQRISATLVAESEATLKYGVLALMEAQS